MSDVDKLREACKSLNADPEPFVVGDIVCWKPGLRNKRFPKKDQPAIVVEIPEKPTEDESKEPGSQYFKEPLDIILGLMDEDGEFSTYYYDKRRFRKPETT